MEIRRKLTPSKTPVFMRKAGFSLLSLMDFSPCRLIDGTNITAEDDHMWLIPFSFGENHLLTIHFDKSESIAGLRFWNYNKSPEDTYRGVSKRKGALPAKIYSGALENWYCDK